MTSHHLPGRGLLTVACTLIMVGCALAPIPPADSSNAPPPASAAGKQLNQLLADSDEAFLQRNPIWAIYRGDLRFAALHGDYLTPAYVGAEREAAQSELRRLAGIDRSTLDVIGRSAYDTFEWQRRTGLRRHQPELAATWLALTLDHFNGWHMSFPDLSSGKGAAPYKTVADYDNGLERLAGFVVYLDRAVALARAGAARGAVQPRVVVQRLIEQFDRFATHTLEQSPYYGPILEMPASISGADQERLRQAYSAAFHERLVPAFRRAHDALRSEVLPHARAGVGLSQMPGGQEYYEFLIAEHTTTDLSPKTIHEMGLAQVALMRSQMESVRQSVGFVGDLPQFFAFIRTDPRFKPDSANELHARYLAIGAKVDATLPRLFAQRPKSALEIRPTPDYIAPTDAGASYNTGAPDGSRPGLFYFNTYDLPSRTMQSMEALYLHEAVPGHHMQIMLAAENEALPKTMRFGGNTAYVEGWAHYAETLGEELGLYSDPYQRFGHIDEQMWRALRLVVDTGIHTLGWTREQAIDYMLANCSLSTTDAIAEVERYIAIPAQALAYKIGQLTIRRLRTKAEQALGARFNVREFHTQVLMTGALPMQVLEAKIDGWISAELRR